MLPRDGQDEFLERACNHRLLSSHEEMILAQRIEKGDMDAKRTLIEHNVRLAVQLARKYQRSGVPFDDLCQEAFIGLNRAAEKFDWRREYKFSTYATWWVRHMLQRAIHKDRATIRVPGHIIERQRKIDRYLAEKNPDATDEELSVELEIKLHHVTDARQTVRVVHSIDAAITSSDDGNKGDWHAVIADGDASDPAEFVNDAFEPLLEAMDSLEPLERQVLRLRFGFDGPAMSRDAVAERLGVKAHAVQRAQRSALEKLKCDTRLDRITGSFE